MKVVVAPDAFKGSLPAHAAAAALADGWREVRPDDELVEVPLADGGEGTSAALESAHPDALWHDVDVAGPDGRVHPSGWLELPDGTAVVELAEACGLPLLARPDPLGAHTTGLGQLLRAAAAAGVHRITVGLGGSASTDGGTGALRSLGARFLDDDGVELPPGGGPLDRLARVELEDVVPPPPGGVRCLSDVTAPLLGPGGAAAVFGPQKGAVADDLVVLERGLARLADVLAGVVPGAREAVTRPGAGAAGGTGFGLAVVWGAELVPGADAVAEMLDLDELLADAAVVLTGEGAFDATSLSGKVVGSLLARLPGDVRVGLAAGRVDGPVPTRIAAHRELVTLAGGTDGALGAPAMWLAEAGRELATALGGSTGAAPR